MECTYNPGGGAWCPLTTTSYGCTSSKTKQRLFAEFVLEPPDDALDSFTVQPISMQANYSSLIRFEFKFTIDAALATNYKTSKGDEIWIEF